MADKAREIVVNTALEDPKNNPNITSLREAITEANKDTTSEIVYINFRKESATRSKSWHIKPNSPLPAIVHKNIYFNYNIPKNVTIDGTNLSEKDGRTYSLLTVGNYANINSSEPGPKAHFKHINLVNNTATAEHGSNGGGGGLAAGAGMSILHGDVVLENIVFQNLKAVGGAKSNAPGGAQAAYWGRVYPNSVRPKRKWQKGLFNKPQEGKKGGTGGRPTLLGADIASSGGDGGGAGKPNERDKTPGADGGHGTDGSFGVGGGGGGGGGGGAFAKGQSCLFGLEIFGCKKTSNQYGDGGDGGNGGKGGFGAGGGAGGTGGENALGQGHRQPGGSGGSGGSTHGNNAGSRGANSNNSDGQKVAGGASRSGAGDALGAALAALNPHSKLDLINIDFVNNKAESKHKAFNNLYAINAGSSKEQISGESIYTFSSKNEAEGQELTTNSLINDQDHYIKLTTRRANYKPSNIHTATSWNREDSIAKIRDVEVKHRSGHPEITTIRVEQPGSSLRTIDIDSSALEASINNLYKRVIPVEDEKTIKKRFMWKMIGAFISAGSGTYSSKSKADLYFKASENEYDEDSQASTVKWGAATAGAFLLKDIFEAHKSYQHELEQNRKNLAELNRLEKIDRRVTAEPIDIGQRRSLITIKNFTIGEDVIYLEDFWSDNHQDFSPIIRNGMGKANDEKVETFEIHLKTPRNSNAPTKVAEVQLDPESVRKLNSALQTDAVGYINALLQPNTKKKQWEIGTTLTDPQRIFQSSNHYTGGPAGEIVVINRPNLNNLSGTWSTTTFNYNDRITGSKGSEEISTNGGNDFIKPSYGRDTVNGGESIDWVNYADLKEPITAIGHLTKNNLNQDINTITINNEANTNREQIIESILENVEIITSFGASNFNLGAAPAPNPLSQSGTSDELPGFYAIRSGSGSTIKGSPFDDRIIISFMEDENESNYADSKQPDDSSSNQKILTKPSVITGNTGNDYLTFAFSNQAPELSITNVDNDGEYKDFKAVINKTNNTVIAFFKGIDSSKVNAIHEAEDKPSTPINIDSGSFRYTFEKTSADEILETTKTEDKTQTEFDIDDEVNVFQGVLETPSQLADTPLKALYGQRGKDSLIGSPTADIIVGRKGDDQLRGKSGNDIFIGGSGRNHIKPGPGHDQIHLNRHGVQIIHGFNPRRDLLVMPRNFRNNLLDFSKSKITYNDQLIAKIVDF